MKDKWCIKLNESSKYYISLYTGNHINYGYSCSYIISNQQWGDRSIYKSTEEYPEITLEELIDILNLKPKIEQNYDYLIKLFKKLSIR
jgi:hypothetical protein